MPADSYSRIVRPMFNGPPNPVSASAITGMLVCFATISPTLANSVCVMMDRSGSPQREPLVPLPARYKKSNPTELATWADIPSNTPGPIKHLSRYKISVSGDRSLVVTFLSVKSDLLVVLA